MAGITAEQFIAALREVEDRGSVDTIAALHADDAEVSNVAQVDPERGPDGARHFWTTYRESFTHVHSEFRNIVQTDRAALLEWTSDVTTAAGLEVSYDGVSVLEFAGDKISRFRAYYNPNTLSAQHTL